MNTEATWKDVVTQALLELGGQGHLTDITAFASKHPKAATNSKVAEKVRQVVRAYSIFESLEEGSGVYRLTSLSPEVPAPSATTTKDITDKIQGQLLFIGRANGYETFAPADDQTKRVFDGQPLRELVTLREGLDGLQRFHPSEKAALRLIDVLWFQEENGELLPRFAFEVENSTDVLTGLQRMSVIPRFFNVQRLIIGPNEAKQRRFNELLQTPAWKDYAPLFGFRFFGEVEQTFETSRLFVQAKQNNEQVLADLLGIN